MNINNNLTMNLMEPVWNCPINLAQGDLNSRSLTLAFYAGTEPWAIPADASIHIRYSKADGKGGEYDLLPDGSPAYSFADNVLTIVLAPQVTTTPGMVSLDVVLRRENTQLSTFPLLLKIQPAVQPTGEDSEDYFHADGFLAAPTEGEVGQYLQIAALDDTGRVSQLTAKPITAVVTPVNAESELWSQWNSRLSFGMDPAAAPVPFQIGGQLLVDGTIIARNAGTKDKNRHGYHVYEAYSKDNFSRMTLVLDKHEAETNGKPSMELYYYTGANHFASSYGNTKIGSDVALHSFCFDRDKLTAYGEIDSKLPITLARISLTKDINTDCKTVKEADLAYEPEAYPEENLKCLKYLALKNAQNGAMFYDTDRNKPVMKVNGQWCELPLLPIEDMAYDILYEDGILVLEWENGVYNQRGESVDNAARLRLAEYLPRTVTSITANEGYEFGVLFLDDNHWSDNEAYYNASTGALQHTAVYYTALDLTGISFETYPNVTLIARRTDLAAIDPTEGSNIICR